MAKKKVVFMLDVMWCKTKNTVWFSRFDPTVALRPMDETLELI